MIPLFTGEVEAEDCCKDWGGEAVSWGEPG